MGLFFWDTLYILPIHSNAVNHRLKKTYISDCRSTIRVAEPFESSMCFHSSGAKVQKFIPLISLLVCILVVATKLVLKKINSTSKRSNFIVVSAINLFCFLSLCITYTFLSRKFDCSLIKGWVH